MNLKKFVLPLIAISVLIAYGSSSAKSFSNSKNEDDSLLLRNIEALTLPENNPNEMYGYELTPCYDKKEIAGREITFKSGEKCLPIKPESICVRTYQWGYCP